MWLINYSEIDFPLNKSRSIFRSHLTSNYSSKNISNKSITTGKTQAIENRPTSVQSGMNSSLFGGSQKFCKVGYYKGNRVAIKQVRKSSITIDRELLVEMKQMID
ncbi:uncharacterized protein, partial [Antedon mediterranea]|uniref:uncharacterized protein n=1 Tax=Antedon mediterranea TaxID=105859 RepID=UPI003AF589E0